MRGGPRRLLLRPDGLPERGEEFAAAAEWALFDVVEESVGLLAIDGRGNGAPASGIVDVYACENVTGKDAVHHWAVGRAQYVAAHEWAREYGLTIVGQIHTHIQDGPDPSEQDIGALPRGGIGAVWHLRSETMTWFTKAGIVGREPFAPSSQVSRWLARLYCS